MELIGEVNRLECILERISETFRDKVENHETDCTKRTLNSQEAIARGAVLAALRSRMSQEPLAYDLETETEGSLSEEKIAEYQQTERKLQEIESFYN